MKQQSENYDKIIIIKSKTRLESLTERFNTKSQADFFLKQQRANIFSKKEFISEKMQQSLATNFANMKEDVGSGDFSDFQEEHNTYQYALERVQKTCSRFLKTKTIESSFLPSFIFTENDVVVVVGRDGLVANTAKYVTDIPIIGVNPDIERNDGILLPFDTNNLEWALDGLLKLRYKASLVTMAEVVLDDGQRLLAFNDLFIGPKAHTSARYQITYSNITENHSSSGLIVSTGAGSTGWMSSLFNMARGMCQVFGSGATLEPQCNNWETDNLIFIVREPFLSKMSQINIPAGIIRRGDELIIESLMPDDGIIFSDGVIQDSLTFTSGKIAKIGIASERAKLILKS